MGSARHPGRPTLDDPPLIDLQALTFARSTSHPSDQNPAGEPLFGLASPVARVNSLTCLGCAQLPAFAFDYSRFPALPPSPASHLRPGHCCRVRQIPLAVGVSTHRPSCGHPRFVVRTGVTTLWITQNSRSRGIFELTGLSPKKVASPQKFLGRPPQVHRLCTSNRLTLGSIAGTMTPVMSPTLSFASGRIIIIR